MPVPGPAAARRRRLRRRHVRLALSYKSSQLRAVGEDEFVDVRRHELFFISTLHGHFADAVLDARDDAVAAALLHGDGHLLADDLREVRRQLVITK